MSGQEGEVKLIFLGDSAVGKSSFIAKMCKLCSPPVGPTITPAYSTVKLHLPSGRAQHIAVWDTAGQEKFRTMLPMYYRSANAAIIMYDVTDRQTFEATDAWLHELRRHQPNILTVALVGNKTDLDQRQVSPEEARAFAEQRGLLFWEVSVLEANKLTPLLKEIVYDLLPKMGRSQYLIEPLDMDHLKLAKAKGRRHCCC